MFCFSWNLTWRWRFNKVETALCHDFCRECLNATNKPMLFCWQIYMYTHHLLEFPWHPMCYSFTRLSWYSCVVNNLLIYLSYLVIKRAYHTCLGVTSNVNIDLHNYVLKSWATSSLTLTRDTRVERPWFHRTLFKEFPVSQTLFLKPYVPTANAQLLLFAKTEHDTLTYGTTEYFLETFLFLALFPQLHKNEFLKCLIRFYSPFSGFLLWWFYSFIYKAFDFFVLKYST